jgi:hypothetical protein
VKELKLKLRALVVLGRSKQAKVGVGVGETCPGLRERRWSMPRVLSLLCGQ